MSSSASPSERPNAWRWGTPLPQSDGWFPAATAAIARGGVLAVVLAAPWFFGGVRGWFQVWCFAGLFGCVVCWIIGRRPRRGEDDPLPTALLPLALALGLGLVQLIPLDGDALRRLSPKAAEFRELLLPAPLPSTELPPLEAQRLAEGAAPPASAAALSVYPAATRRELSMLALGVVAFALGARYFNRATPQFVLFAAVAINGAALAVFGLAQKLAWNGLMYWRFPLLGGGDPFGPFINRNNAGGYLNLALAAALGLLLRVLAGPKIGLLYTPVSTAPSDAAGPAPASDPPTTTLRDFAGSLNGLSLGAISLAIGLLAGVLCSLSRGAILALAAGIVTTALAVQLLSMQKIRWRWLWPCGAAAVLLLVWLGFTATIGQRLGTLLFEESLASNARVLNWRESLRSVPDFWLTGSGLGTYGYIYRPYQLAYHNSWHLHAENQYVEALVNGGAPGLMLLVATITLVAIAASRLLRGGGPEPLGLGVAGVLALATQAAQAVVDFGLYVPANMLLLAVICGAVCGGAARHSTIDQRPPSRWLALPATARLTPIVQLGLLAAAVLGWWEVNRAAPIESILRVTRWGPQTTPPTRPQVVDAIEDLSPAVRARWDDADGQLRLAWLWMWLYRLEAFEHLQAELSPTLDDRRLQMMAKPSQLHFQASQAALSGKPADLARLRSLPVVANFLQPAWRHLAAARQACPLQPEVHFQLGVLAFLAGDPLADKVEFDRVRLLTPHDADYLYEIALLDLDSGRTEQALSDLRAAWMATPHRQDEILNILSQRMEFDDILQRVVPTTPEMLLRLAETKCVYDPAFAPRRSSVLDRAEPLVEAMPQDTAVQRSQRLYLLGRLARARGDTAKALQSFQQGIEQAPEHHQRRFELASYLLELGRLDEARQQAQACQALQPSNRQYSDFVKRLDEALLKRAREHMLKP